ncbi:MAG: MFS transporter [Gemmatimonadota bacterium]
MPENPSTDATTERRRVLAASAIGTTIEWYDFFIYSTSAALVFSKQFFSAFDPATALLLSMASLGVTFVVRPFGSAVTGHFGDRIGRKKMLVLTLGVMGAATVGVGLLPPYQQIGVWAPILLVLLRCLQGFSAGGEWAGAALMAVEHAPAEKRAWYGSAAQIGVPIGLMLANAMFLIMTKSTSNEQFMRWGWRVPFLLSIGLVALGFYIRNRVSESPVFAEMKATRREARAPLAELWAKHKRPVVLAAGTFLGNNMVGYIFLSFLLSYSTNTLGLPRDAMLGVVIAGSLCWLVTILVSGRMADRTGARTLFIAGYVAMMLWSIPFMLMVDSRNLPVIVVATLVLTATLGFTYGAQAALFAGLFPTGVRYSGASMAYAFGAILGGGFAPLLASYLVAKTGSGLAVGAYMVVATAVSVAASVAIRESDMVGLAHGAGRGERG